MIFNNEKFKHISFEKILDLLFAHKLDYKNLIHLNYYIDNGINIFEADESFNSFDKYDNRTEFLHTTNRITQPWKTGLKIDFKKYINNGYISKKYLPYLESK